MSAFDRLTMAAAIEAAHRAMAPTATEGPANDHLEYYSEELSQIVDTFVVSGLGQPLGAASLDEFGKIYSAQLPAIAISDTFVVASQAEMLALNTADVGDIAVRTDISKTFILTFLPASMLTNWQELLTSVSLHSSTHGEAGSDPLTLSPSQVTGLSTTMATVAAATSVASADTLVKRDADAGFEAAYLQVDTTPATPQTGAAGKIIWNDTMGTLEFGLKGGVVNLQVGQENVLRVRNQEVTPLADGEVVYVTGSSGTHVTVLRADASLEATSSTTIGVVTEPIGAHPGEGYITTFGMVTCDTNHLTEGAAVWLSTVAGQTTDVRPTAPDHAVAIGWCVKKAGAADGRIFVHVQNGYELSELHDVLITALASGDTLYYDGAVWRNRTAAASPWVLKTGDIMAVPTGTALTINSTDGLGELPIKVRVAAATTGSGQAGMDYGFNNSYRITQAVAGTGIGSPFGGSGYLYCSGIPLRLITDNIARGIEFWAGSIYAGRVFNGTTQLGTAPSGTSTTGIPLYCGKNAVTVQARLGDASGNCWSLGRDNVSTGDLIIEPTVPAGTTPFASALRVLLASGITRATYGLQIGSAGTTLTQAKVYTPNLTPIAVSAGAAVEETFTVTGLSTSDTVTVNPPGAAVLSARVSAADTLALTFAPPASGSYTPPAGVYRIIAFRS